MKCPYCNKGNLEKIEANEPYSDEHYQCGECCSTYTVESYNELEESK